jgi:NADPH2:quinone reductase
MLLFNVGNEDKAAIHAALGAALENGTLKPIVSRELPLAEAPRAHQLIIESGAHGKIILIP